MVCLELEIWGGKMDGADRSSELWRYLLDSNFLFIFCAFVLKVFLRPNSSFFCWPFVRLLSFFCSNFHLKTFIFYSLLSAFTVSRTKFFVHFKHKKYFCCSCWNTISLTKSWSYQQIFNLNLLYTHFRALLLVEIFEQPMRMLKNEHSVDLC